MEFTQEQISHHELLSTRPHLYEIHRTFVDSEFSERLEQMPPRFAQKHDAQGAFSRELFIETMGIDVDHATHPVRQWQVLTEMLSSSTLELSPEEIEALELTAIVHDFGEAVTVKGDIAYGDKTAEDDAEEVIALEEVLNRLFGAEMSGHILGIVLPVMDRDTKLGSIFYTSEKLGYALSQLRAWHAAQTEPNFSPDQVRVLRAIASQVDLHLPYLANQQHFFPVVYDFIQRNHQDLQKMLSIADVRTIQDGTAIARIRS